MTAPNSRRWWWPAGLLVLGAGGLAVLGWQLASTGRAMGERSARESLRAKAEAAAADLRGRASELLRWAAAPEDAGPHADDSVLIAVADDAGGVITPPAPRPLKRPAPPRGLVSESDQRLEAAESAERSGDVADALRILRDLGKSAAPAGPRTEAWVRAASLLRRSGAGGEVAEAEDALLASAAPAERQDRFEILLARARRRSDLESLRRDLMLRIGTADEPLALGLLREAGLDADAARADRLRELEHLRILESLLRDPASVAEGAALRGGFLVAWITRGAERRFASVPAPVTERGVECHEGRPLPSAADQVTETVAVGGPLVGATVRAFVPRDVIEAGARRGMLLLGAALGLLLLGGGGASLLAVRAAREEARAARERADFVTRVGHDLRTPLALVRLYAETLAEGRVTDPAEAREFAAVASREAERLTGMVESVMDLSRDERPGGASRHPLDLAELVADVVSSHEPLAAKEEVTLRLQRGGPLPVTGDAAALRGALGNLLANAVRHGGAGEVRVTASKEGDRAVVEVSDDGPGIPAGWDERVFERFVRGPGARGSGAGLGLALVRETARGHGGDAMVVRGGAGATVRVVLPVEGDG